MNKIFTSKDNIFNITKSGGNPEIVITVKD